MKNDQPIVESNSDELLETKSESLDRKSSYHRSEARSHKGGFFHRVKHEHEGISQVTNVNVKIEQAKDDDPVSGCFKSIFKCIK